MCGSLVAGVGALGLATYLRRQRQSAGVQWFAVSLVGVAAWCLTYGVGLLVFAYPLRLHIEALSLAAAHWLGPTFLLFSLQYTGRAAVVRGWRRLALLAVPAVATGLFATHPFHALLWAGAEPASALGLSVVQYRIQPLLFATLLFGLTCAGVAVLLLVETVVSYGPLYRTEAVAVALSTAPPTAGLVPWLLGVGPVPALNLAPPLFAFHVLLDGYAFLSSDMFETSPTTQRAAERDAIDDIRTPVVVTDTAGRIVKPNAAAVSLFDIDTRDGLGDPLTDYVAVALDDLDGTQWATVREAGRSRQYSVVVSALTDPSGRTVGRTVVFQDVTQEREREQRLDVLNRIIRHNLRNEMTVIRGHADVIEDRADDGQVTDSASTIERSADRLLATGEKAREFERVLDTPGRQSVDVTTFVESVVADFRVRFPDATVDVETTVPVKCETEPAILRLVLGNLMENALEHGSHVTVSVESDDGDVTLAIHDDGPGITPEELAPIRRGQETALEHSTGIGLWVVRWGVAKLGGDVSFAPSDDGTTVRVSLPGRP